MIVFGILLAAAAANGAQTHKCAIPGGELVPNAQVARALAEAIIRGKQTAEESAGYALSVEPDGNRAWVVFQSIPPRKEPDGSVTTINGGGVAFRIDRCNAAVSNFTYII